MDSHALSSERDPFIRCTNNRWEVFDLASSLLTVIQAHDLNSFIVINHYYYLLNIMALFIGYTPRITIEAFIMLKIYIQKAGS